MERHRPNHEGAIRLVNGTALAIRDETGYLAACSEIRALVERIETVGDAKDLADRARAAQVWAERAGLAQSQVNVAIVAKLWAERRAGELLAVPPGNRYTGKTLPVNVSKGQSHRWQKLAGLPLAFYEQAVADAVAAGRVTLEEVFRRVDRLAREDANAAAEHELLADLAERGGPTWSITHADLRDFDPGPVDAIVTDPPYITEDAVELYAELGRFALRTLRPGGALLTMVSHQLLLGALDALAQPGLVYRWMIAYLYGSHESTVAMHHRVQDCWKPVLVYHHGAWSSTTPMFPDVVSSGRHQQKDVHPWQQTLAGTRQLVRAVARPGDIVCDPFTGAGTTTVAALAESCHFVGCDIDANTVEVARNRIAA
jgi:SAM-dependent methyltransferase